MHIAVNSDFLHSSGSPRPWLHAAADAGFSHLHWCHHWSTDYLYSPSEIDEARKWLEETGLTLLDIHGSAGQEKCWFAEEEYRRLSGVQLVKNRVEMFAELNGTGSIMMHIPCIQAKYTRLEAIPTVRRQVDALKRSLDELTPVLERHHVLLAVENMWADTFEIIRELFEEYPPHLLGLCYDSGHANDPERNGMDDLFDLRSRLQALHLHDNDGRADLHQPPFYGTVDWTRLASILADSPYPRVSSFEIGMRNTPFFESEHGDEQKPESVAAFLADAFERCERFANQVNFQKKQLLNP